MRRKEQPEQPRGKYRANTRGGTTKTDGPVGALDELLDLVAAAVASRLRDAGSHGPKPANATASARPTVPQESEKR